MRVLLYVSMIYNRGDKNTNLNKQITDLCEKKNRNLISDE